MLSAEEWRVSILCVNQERYSNDKHYLVTVAGVVFIIGGILQTAAPNKEAMFAGRFFAGIGIGMLGLLTPCMYHLFNIFLPILTRFLVYQSEIGTPEPVSSSSHLAHSLFSSSFGSWYAYSNLPILSRYRLFHSRMDRVWCCADSL